MYTPSGHADRRDLVEEHKGLVKKLAGIMKAKLPPSVELDDLVQAGMIGLWGAAKTFDPSQDVKFETYAGHRVRGAMLEELRESDWVPRRVRERLRSVEAALASLRHRLGRQPSEAEVAREMGLGLDDYQELLFEGTGAQLLYLEDLAGGGSDETFLDRFTNDDSFEIGEASPEGDPLAILSAQSFRKELAQAIDALPEREKLLMGLYYQENLNLKEIGAVLGVSEARVSQLHSQAVSRLRTQLKGI
jgi:RNA polymerase sigma factor for flagellar operon FliA